MSSAVKCLSLPEILCPIFDHLQDDRITLYSALFVNSTWSRYTVEVLWRSAPLFTLNMIDHSRQRIANDIHTSFFWKGDYLFSAPGCERPRFSSPERCLLQIDSLFRLDDYRFYIPPSSTCSPHRLGSWVRDAEEIDPCESWKRQCSFSRLPDVRLALRVDPANNVALKPDPRPRQTPGGYAQFLERSPKLRCVLAASSTRSHSGIAAFFGRLTSLENLEELSLPLLWFDHVSLTRWIHQREGKRVSPKLTHLAIQISSQGAQILFEPILSRLTSLTIGLLNSRDV